MKIGRDGSIPVIVIDYTSDAKSPTPIVRLIRRNPDKFSAVMDKIREEQRRDGPLPHASRDRTTERQRDEEDGPPKNRAILEKPDRI